jgi:SP family general alpha glucoside:H+ symporter-like MFS transporter
MPESPTWLISVNRDARAAQALKRLGNSEQAVEKNMATIRLTLERARAESSGSSYMEW